MHSKATIFLSWDSFWGWTIARYGEQNKNNDSARFKFSRRRTYFELLFALAFFSFRFFLCNHPFVILVHQQWQTGDYTLNTQFQMFEKLISIVPMAGGLLSEIFKFNKFMSSRRISLQKSLCFFLHCNAYGLVRFFLSSPICSVRGLRRPQSLPHPHVCISYALYNSNNASQNVLILRY